MNEGHDDYDSLDEFVNRHNKYLINYAVYP